MKNLCFFIGFIFPILSGAKIHIEPYAGWSGTTINPSPLQKENVSGAESSLNYLNEGEYYTGPALGMRVGYSALGLAVGLDITSGYWSALYTKKKVSAQKKNIIPTLVGLFASYKLPIMLRAYFSLIPHSPLQIQTEEDFRSCISRGFKLGASWTSLPFVNVSLEYMPLFIKGNSCHSWSHTGTVYVNAVF